MNHFNGPGSDGIRLHYVREGKGSPVLLLHGWPGYWFDWRAVFPRLSAFADVIAPDFRGFGLSDKPRLSPADGYSPRAFAQDIVTLLKSLNMDQVIVVAHDIGATIAQLLAREYPKLVESLVLLNPPYPGIGERRFSPSAQTELWYQSFHLLDLFEQLMAEDNDNVEKYVRHFYRHWCANQSRLREIELQEIVRTYSQPGALFASVQYYRARAAEKRGLEPAAIPKIKQKTSVLWGAQDPVMKVDWADRLDDWFADYSLTVLDNVGHFVPFESPDEVIRAVGQHVDEWEK